MIINLTDAMQAGNTYLPKRLYRVRCNKAKYNLNNKGNPMTTLDCEIISPEEVEIPGGKARCVGRSFALRIVHKPGEEGSLRQIVERLQATSDIANYDTDKTAEYFVITILDRYD